MECEGCPLKKVQVVMTQEITTGKSYTQDDTGYAWCPAMYETCHLTLSDMEIIRAMITGRFNCEHCWHGAIEGKGETVYCVMAGNSVPVTCFCDRWHERKEGEDGS